MSPAWKKSRGIGETAMKRSTIRCTVFCALLLGLGAAHGAPDQVVLAMPARHDLVNLGFDFLSMFPRSMNLVCYSGAGESLALERYDSAAGRWLPLSTAAWATARADALVLVGEGAAVRQLQSSAVWAGQPSVVTGQRLHEVANAVNAHLRMNTAQWRRLADTYGFTLEDRNAEARRYGRFGRPGARRAPRERPMPPSASGSLILRTPPRPIFETSRELPPAPVAEAPAETAPVAAIVPLTAEPIVGVIPAETLVEAPAAEIPAAVEPAPEAAAVAGEEVKEAVATVAEEVKGAAPAVADAKPVAEAPAAAEAAPETAAVAGDVKEAVAVAVEEVKEAAAIVPEEVKEAAEKAAKEAKVTIGEAVETVQEAVPAEVRPEDK